MTISILEQALALNRKKYSIREIAEKLKYSMTYINKILKRDPRYKPGKKGFASMNKEKHHRIASMGGRKAHSLGRSHRWTSIEAGIAGKKGGIVSRIKRNND